MEQNWPLYLLDTLIMLTALLLVIGLVRPWYVLWFLALKNRIKVLRYFLPVLVLLLLLRGLLVNFLF